jgi:RNA polymerase sigma factor (sigma-70 family)
LDGSCRRSIAALFGAGSCAGLSDRELLERSLTRRDEAAFAILVERHGPMVLRVCRDTLRDPHDARDAFQATFLVLIERGGTIRSRDALASWLHGVARRVAGGMRSSAARRQRHERAASRRDDHAEPDNVGDPEVARILQDELGRLPERYRMAVVLCDLEGLGMDEAARRLGCPVGTLKSRLARGRDRLRSRLTRRGLAPAAILADRPAPVVVPKALVESTARLFATGGQASLPVLSLARGVSRMMTLSSWKPVGAALVVALAVPVGARWLTQAHAADGPKRVGAARDEPARPSARVRKPLPAYIVEPPDLISVTVRKADPDSALIRGERLVRPDGTISLSDYGPVYVAGLTTTEIKEKVILHLRKYLDDATLGLVEEDPATGKPRAVPPADSTRVIVEVNAYNSKVYYVQGDVAVPGRLPITGSETVLDAINMVGGLVRTASKEGIRLVRPAPPGASEGQILPIDYEAIVERGDVTTNYPLMPGDRILVPRDPATIAREDRSNAEVQELNRRLTEVERKLDRILEALGQREPEPR